MRLNMAHILYVTHKIWYMLFSDSGSMAHILHATKYGTYSVCDSQNMAHIIYVIRVVWRIPYRRLNMAHILGSSFPLILNKIRTF